jgi:hypothetical protein
MSHAEDPRWHALASLAALEVLSEAERLELSRALAAALGTGFSPSPELVGTLRLPGVVHEHGGTTRARTTFAAVPGGELDMGLRPDERDELVSLIADEDDEDDDGGRERREADANYLLARAVPVHRVTVRPFLLATETLLLEQARALSQEIAKIEVGRGRFAHMHEIACLLAAEVPALLAGAPAGFRLACEAEWEWTTREGGSRSWVIDPYDWLNYESRDAPNAFGVWFIADGPEWLADAWFPNHDGAPSTSLARDPRAEPGVSRGVHSGWQDKTEVVVTACAYREEATATCYNRVRFARDLP